MTLHPQSFYCHRFIKGVMALSLVPLEDIDDAWLELDGESPAPEHPAHQNLAAFKEYFIKNWLKNETVYPRDLWNHYK